MMQSVFEERCTDRNNLIAGWISITRSEITLDIQLEIRQIDFREFPGLDVVDDRGY